ncbi:MAG: DUF1275 domain-containing protein [Lachnospiraceae bacterium]|nr:DUF1275 domain-containing protein [Lachnospiraceae bacterium]
MNSKKQISESLFIGILLSLAGGFLDAYTYLVRGAVFANAQTGNMVLMGIYFANSNFLYAFRYFIPVLAFILGVILSEAIKGKYKASPSIHWRQITVCIELIVIIIVAFLPKNDYDMLANVLVSFVCSMQVQSFRKLNGNTYATTMCTGNLRSATEEIINYHKTKDTAALKASLQYFIIIGIFIVGALLGGLLCGYFGIYTILFAAAILFIALLLMFL